MNILHDESECKQIRCELLIKPGICKNKGKLQKYFECREIEIAEARNEAGLK